MLLNVILVLSLVVIIGLVRCLRFACVYCDFCCIVAFVVALVVFGCLVSCSFLLCCV